MAWIRSWASIEARYRALVTICAAICMSLMTFLVLIYFVPGPATGNRAFSLLLNCAGIVPLGISFLAKQRILDQAIAEQKIDRVQAAYVLAFALCEAAWLLAVLDHFINGPGYYYVGFIFGGLGLLLHFPRKQYLLDASQKQS